MIAINPIPAFNDNYFWLVDNGREALVVDPGDAKPVIEYLKARQLKLKSILVTHHHADHTGGVSQLKSAYGCEVFGPLKDPVNHLDNTLDENDSFTLDYLDLSFKVISVPGHTLGHIAYFSQGNDDLGPTLFCGDTLFSAGCGRLFEGTASQMWHSMQKLLMLPEQTKIYPAHEYTQANLEFALSVEPDNSDIISHLETVKNLRKQNKPSLPSTLGKEKRINPFLRVEQHELKLQVGQRAPQSVGSAAEVFAEVRRWKDSF